MTVGRTVGEFWWFNSFHMAFVRHLGFVVWMLGPPTKSIFITVKNLAGI